MLTVTHRGNLRRRRIQPDGLLHYWDRQRIGQFLTTTWPKGTEVVVTKAMKRKAVYRSAVTREKASLPIVCGAQSAAIFALASESWAKCDIRISPLASMPSMFR